MMGLRWSMNQLEQARVSIDQIDREIAQLYEERMKVLKDVAAYKIEHDLPVVDRSREQKIIQKNKEYIQEEAYRDSYARVLKFIIKESCDYQRSLLANDVIGYAGVEGAFSHRSAQRLFPHHKLVGFGSFEDVFQAVVDREVEFGVIPFENTNSGLVGEVLDALFKFPVYINRVSDQKIEQCLLGIKGASLKDVEWIYSKDQALHQAKRFIKDLKAQPIAYPNTAMAAQYVALQKDKTKAAIGAKENAALYGLDILASHIEENSENTTRFLVVSLKPNPTGERFGMGITLKNEVGALAKVIEVIAKHGLNMSSIQSRPRKGHPFEYFFFIEIEGTMQKEALEDMKTVCEEIKVLGAY